MRRFLLLAPLSLCVLGSCKEDEIRTYRVGTDSTADTPAPPAADVAAKEDHPGLSVSWQAPGDWKQEDAAQFVAAAYALPSGGRVTVSKLAGDGGGLVANLNRWRGQVGLNPIADNEVPANRSRSPTRMK